MRLQERLGRKEDKPAGKISGILRQKAEQLYKFGRGGLGRVKHAKPQLLVGEEKAPPTVQHGYRDAETGTKPFHRAQMQEVFR